jgi:hypothetical protein
VHGLTIADLPAAAQSILAVSTDDTTLAHTLRGNAEAMRQSDNGPDSAPWSEVIVEVVLNPGNEQLVFPRQGEPAMCGSWCMAALRVRLLERYVSRDGLQQLYVFTAPDADAVRRVVETYFGRAALRLSAWPTRG